MIVNPASRGGAGRRVFERLAPRIREALGDVDVEATRAPRDAERIAREAVRAGVERVVVAGGDGTASEVVSGLLEAGLGERAELGLLPLGTGGDLLRTLGVPRDLDAALQAIAGGSVRRIDAGRVRHRDRDGKDASSWFVNVASFGISGLTTELVNRAPKFLGGRLSFLIGTVRAIAAYRPASVELRLDGEPIHEGPLVLGTAANGRFFGGGMCIAPEARIDDGALDVVVIPGFTKARLLAELPRIYRGTHLGVEGVIARRGRTLEALPLGDAPWLELDGEPLGRLPARFEVVPSALRILGGGKAGA